MARPNRKLGIQRRQETYHKTLEVDCCHPGVRFDRRAPDGLCAVSVAGDRAVFAADGFLGEGVAIERVADSLLSLGSLDADLWLAHRRGQGGVFGPVPVGDAEGLGGALVLGPLGLRILLCKGYGMVDEDLLYSV